MGEREKWSEWWRTSMQGGGWPIAQHRMHRKGDWRDGGREGGEEGEVTPCCLLKRIYACHAIAPLPPPHPLIAHEGWPPRRAERLMPYATIDSCLSLSHADVPCCHKGLLVQLELCVTVLTLYHIIGRQCAS